ncbi:uncharacterized protein LOC141661716 [Apium graveolens]|uniref:uncharacterized protein LOC141661716 n=1 Tax=Apium graveolens TaxID=4045 RepID=UPI003D79C97F
MVHMRFSLSSEASGSRSRSKLSLSVKKKQKPKQKPKSPSKKNRSKVLLKTDLLPPHTGMRYIIPLDMHKGAKISRVNKYDPITDLRALLSDSQLSVLKNSCFGYLMDLPNFKVQNQLIHNLFVRKLKQPNEDEIWVGISGKILNFGIKEFATVTGLLCLGNYDKMRYSKVENGFVEAYYSGTYPVFKSSIKNSILGKEWKNDIDAIKMAKMYLLHHFLLTSTTDSHISKGDLDILDSDKFDYFPWGKDIFKMTLESLKYGASTTLKDYYYRLNGFPYAFQLWFYECCPYLNGKYYDNKDVQIPHLLNWSNDSLGKFEDYY